jgi:hypothetical protein
LADSGRAMIQKKAGPPRTDRRGAAGLCTHGWPASAGRARDNGTPRPSSAIRRAVREAERTLVCWSRLRSAAAPSTPARAGIAKNPCARRRLCRRGGDVHRLTDSVNGNEGERKKGLLPHNAYGTRFATRPLQAHPFAAFKTGTGVRAEVPKSKKAYRRARSPFVPAALSRVSNADAINDKSRKLPSRGRLWLFPAVCASSPG